MYQEFYGCMNWDCFASSSKPKGVQTGIEKRAISRNIEFLGTLDAHSHTIFFFQRYIFKTKKK